MAPSVFDKYRIVLLASEGCLNRDHVDLLLLNPASAAPCANEFSLPFSYTKTLTRP
jgi:hypothetical protein